MGGTVLATVCPSSARAQNVNTTVAAGNFPCAVAVNPLTNRIYVANLGHDTDDQDTGNSTVTVIDGATNATTTIPVGNSPISVAVNSVTNKIFVPNQGSNNVSVIDGATNATTTVAAGIGPSFIAVNAATNRIYVSNVGSNNVTVIDGTTNSTSTVPAGKSPFDIAVNVVTNEVYVVNEGSDNVTVIDGATNATTTVAAGSSPTAIAVNPMTNKAYVANEGSNTVTVIDGATHATTTVPSGNLPGGIVVNPVTNRIYVANVADNTVTVIDGATNATSSVATGFEPFDLAVDPVTDQIYVADQGLDSCTLTVINGSTNATATVATGIFPCAVAVNPVANTAYVPNYDASSVTVIEGAGPALDPSSARLINISARAQIGTGGGELIPGFVIGGIGTETLLIRGDGPSLAQFGVSGALAQPSLSLLNSAGTVIASNTGWSTNADPTKVASAAAQVGAFPLASGSADCALIVNLSAGAYTVKVSSVGNTTGVALAEVYEVSSSGARLINISTRSQVGTGDNIMISGFVISGSGTERLLVRGDGPSLAQFGVTGVLAQPTLSVFDGAGNVVASNTGWATGPDPGLIAGFAAAVGAFALPTGSSGTASSDSAQFVDLPPGAYTMQISGMNNTSGNALAEVYEAP